ncbi:MAG: tellurite resistance TerB family protein [Thiothrix sp.]|nr:MAG: tellurite resistance TerB family protein [Thiothrix sp.]
MDINHLLEQLLKTSKDTVQQGQTLAEQKLGIPAEGAERDSMLSGMKTGAAAAGILALLLGTRTGRKVTGLGLKVGSVAALGGLAYQMYQRWQAEANPTAPFESKASVLLPAPEQLPLLSSETLLKAMVAAAKADGQVDEQELQIIRSKMSELQLDQDLNDLLMNELINPLGAKEVAALANGDQQAGLELYLVSSLFLDKNQEVERVYLNDLQTALNLPDAVVALA